MFTSNIYLILIAIIFGILPDVGRLLQKDPSDWNKFYKWAHTTWYCYLIPFWNLHILLDKPMHAPEGGWTKTAWRYEVTGWIICILFLVWKFL